MGYVGIDPMAVRALAAACESAADEVEAIDRRARSAAGSVGYPVVSVGPVATSLRGGAQDARRRADEVELGGWLKWQGYDLAIAPFWLGAPALSGYEQGRMGSALATGVALGTYRQYADLAAQQWMRHTPGHWTDGTFVRGHWRSTPSGGRTWVRPHSRGREWVPGRVEPDTVTRAKYARYSRYARRGGHVLAVGSATVDQIVNDWDDPDLGAAQRTGRAVAAGGIVGGTSIAGGMGGVKVGALGGAKVGALFGSVIPGAGTAAGAVVGGAIGAVVGGVVGSGVGAAAGEKVKDAAFSAAEAARDAASGVAETVSDWFGGG